jgi:membrane protease subunit HflK
VIDVQAFVLNVRDPEASLRQAADSALRHVVGTTELTQVLSGGRQLMAGDIHQRIQRYLDHYGAGIQVRTINIQEGRPPEEVRSAFDDVIRAREDEERFKNEAQAYANRVIPEARGRAQRMLDEASAYRAEVVARAEGESQRFEQLLTEYQRAPGVTRERVYIETMETVMANVSKVMVDVEGGNNMLYLPLDRMIQSAGTSARGNAGQGISPEVMRQITENVARELGRTSPTTVRREVR